MNICAIICEYNPFHNGHLYAIEQAKKLSNADAILCLMSGDFTQRGEPAVFCKYTRAKHAILCGADAVAELPVLFACSNAEIFAKGAIKILSSVPEITTLCFGAETPDASLFIETAKILNKETPQFKECLKKQLSQGIGYAKARAIALKECCNIDEDFLSSPNNILGIEYTRAILSSHSSLKILPIQRIGANYKDTTTKQQYSSASALRNCMKNLDKNAQTVFENNIPTCVKESIKEYTPFDYFTPSICALQKSNKEELKNILDCNEGLENRLKKLADEYGNYSQIVENCVSKRYTTARIQRILLHNFLGITEKDIRLALSCPTLYFNILAMKKNKKLLSILSQGNVILRKTQTNNLTERAKECFNIDLRASSIYGALTHTKAKFYQTEWIDSTEKKNE